LPEKIAILNGSTAYLPKECLKQYNISIVPPSVIWDNQIYLDGMDILPGEFYERLADSRSMPSTSQITPAAMEGAFRSIIEQGYEVLGIFSFIEGLRHSPFSDTGARNAGVAEDRLAIDSLS
jgi:fatty acid-binding protein DegV